MLTSLHPHFDVNLKNVRFPIRHVLSLISSECYITNLGDAPETELKFDQKAEYWSRDCFGLEGSEWGSD